MDYSDVEEILNTCYEEITSAHRDKYDCDKADRTAALFLLAQIKLSSLIEEVEIKSKFFKNEVVRLEGEKYFEYKTVNTGKITEAMLSNYVAKDADIVSTKTKCAEQEAAIKKWNYVLGTLKDGHIFFRNLSKNKSWSE